MATAVNLAKITKISKLKIIISRLATHSSPCKNTLDEQIHKSAWQKYQKYETFLVLATASFNMEIHKTFSW